MAGWNCDGPCLFLALLRLLCIKRPPLTLQQWPEQDLLRTYVQAGWEIPNSLKMVFPTVTGHLQAQWCLKWCNWFPQVCVGSLTDRGFDKTRNLGWKWLTGFGDKVQVLRSAVVVIVVLGKRDALIASQPTHDAWNRLYLLLIVPSKQQPDLRLGSVSTAKLLPKQ